MRQTYHQGQNPRLARTCGDSLEASYIRLVKSNQPINQPTSWHPPVAMQPDLRILRRRQVWRVRLPNLAFPGPRSSQQSMRLLFIYRSERNIHTKIREASRRARICNALLALVVFLRKKARLGRHQEYEFMRRRSPSPSLPQNG